MGVLFPERRAVPQLLQYEGIEIPWEERWVLTSYSGGMCPAFNWQWKASGAYLDGREKARKHRRLPAATNGGIRNQAGRHCRLHRS